jgi:hypothetical protein
MFSVPNLSPEAVAAVVSALAAVASAAYSWRSNRIARRALHLAEQDHRERHAGLSAYLIEAAFWEDANSHRVVGFACTLTNTANAPTSVVRADLHMHVFDEAGNTSELILPPSESQEPVAGTLASLRFPLILKERESASGWIICAVPDRVVRSMTTERYQLVFLTSTSDKASVESFLLMKIRDGRRQG